MIYGSPEVEFVSLIEGTGFSLPIATITERVDVNIEVTPAARLAVKSAIGEQIDTHVLIISAKAGGCSGYLYDMVVVKDLKKRAFKQSMLTESQS